ncbi:MAG TPA: response regulator [Burkholderiales bacterium]|nr:response regulator [Burkholderiales bacterium]
MSNPDPTIFVVDDDASILRGSQRLLTAAGFNVETFESADAFLNHHDPARSGCLILDVAMPGLNGLELQEALHARHSFLPIIFLTGRADVPISVQAMKGGALDLLVKPVDESDLLAAIDRALARDRELRESSAQTASVEQRLATLTPREREVLTHVIEGRLNKQIAGDLGTVEKTIKVHRARMMEKMQVRSVAELVRLMERAAIRPGTSGQ